MDNVILGIARVLDIVWNIYMWIIIIRALISWVNPDPYNPIVQILTKMTEPVLRPIRKLVPPYKVGIDFSPLIAVADHHLSAVRADQQPLSPSRRSLG